MYNYYPILLSKAGELVALDKLDINVKQEISPIIEVIDNLPTQQLSIIWAFQGNQILIDLSLYDGFNRATIRAFFGTLFANGVNAVPVIQENSDARYIALVQYLIATYNCKVAIRASNGSGGFANFNAVVTTLIASVGSTRASTILVIDLGYVEANNYNILATLAINLIMGIPNKNQYDAITVASGSFLENLTPLAVKNAPHLLPRYEWRIWQTIHGTTALLNLVKYSDYGTKNPFYVPVNYSGSSSIKYTTLNDFVIYRGERAQDHADGNGQYITLAGRLIISPYYSGAGFSWGDTEVDRIAHEVMTNPKKKPGNPGTWVKISQNHHITFLHSVL